MSAHRGSLAFIWLSGLELLGGFGRNYDKEPKKLSFLEGFRSQPRKGYKVWLGLTSIGFTAMPLGVTRMLCPRFLPSQRAEGVPVAHGSGMRP